MKMNKAIATVLTASMLLSMSGCSLFDNDDKAVLAAADKYAQAVTSADMEEIIALTSGGEEDEFSEYIENCMDDNDMSAVFDAILGSMTYEIDQKSVTSSKKDGSASVDITYTIVDYEKLYKELDSSGADVHWFASVIEDNDGDDTIEISQTLKFELDNKEWLVKDKGNKNLSEVYDFFGYEVLGVVRRYVHDVVELRFDDIKEITTYDYTTDLAAYLSYYDMSDEEVKAAFRAVEDSMTFDVDTESLQVSLKNGTASISVDFEIVDYMAVYDKVVGANGNINDYVEALKSSNGEVLDYDQTLVFDLIDGHWIIDSDLYDLYDLFDFYDDIEYYKWNSGNASFDVITVQQFEQALKDTLGLTAKEYYDDQYWTAQYSGGDMKLCIFQQYDLTHASEVYQEAYYDRFMEILAQGKFTGDSAAAFSGTDGYVILDGYIDYNNGWFNHTGYIYGGLFFVDDVFVVCLAYTDDIVTQVQIDMVLEAINYPTPIDYL